MKKKSRWVRGSSVPRYDKKQREYLDKHFPPEQPGWRFGAKVSRR